MIDPNLATIATNLENGLLQQLNTLLSAKIFDNQFLIGGVGTVFLSSVLYFLRNLPWSIWRGLKHRFTVSVDVFSTNSNFHLITKELNENIIHLFSRTKVLDKRDLTIGLGQSWTFFNKRLVYVVREKEKSDSREFKQNLRLVFPFSTNKKIEKLFSDFFKKQDKKKSENIKVYQFAKNSYLEYMKETPKRKEESIFLPQETLDYIKTRIDFFLKNRKWYEEHGIPYKYAILLHGVPGTGKTTVAKFIASFTERCLVYIHPSKLPYVVSHLNEDSTDYINGESSRSTQKYVGLMEDIDCDNVTNKRIGKVEGDEENDEDDIDNLLFSMKTSFTSLSDLLNSIDGINAPEDFILVATTNHINNIDPALFRKGRFDDVIEIKPLEDKDIKRMIHKFFGDIEGIDDVHFNPIPGANLQDLILQYVDGDKQEFIQKLKDYKKC